VEGAVSCKAATPLARSQEPQGGTFWRLGPRTPPWRKRLWFVLAACVRLKDVEEAESTLRRTKSVHRLKTCASKQAHARSEKLSHTKLVTHAAMETTLAHAVSCLRPRGCG
jgi:hypothetical protein